jgi:hypothetical protein
MEDVVKDVVLFVFKLWCEVVAGVDVVLLVFELWCEVLAGVFTYKLRKTMEGLEQPLETRCCSCPARLV